MLFTHPDIGWLVKGVGSVPVYRQQDDPTLVAQNLDSFRDVHRVLAAGDLVGIFPEGISHSASRLAPLKTGAARIAMGAAQQIGHSFPIIAVGLVFRDRDRFRSDAHVIIGEAFAWDDSMGEMSNRSAVRELTDPRRKLVTPKRSRRDTEDDALRVVDRCVELLNIEDEEHFHGRVPDALVAVDERMVADERESECRGPLDERRVQLDIVERRTSNVECRTSNVERRPRLRERGFQRAEVADSGRTATREEHAPVEVEDFSEGKKPRRHGRPGHASRRYSSAFLSTTCAAADS